MNDAMSSSTNSAVHLAQFQRIREALQAQLIGHENLISRLLIALLTGGHVLIEGAPGLAKTRAINRFANHINARFVRVQATPDLLPADITGTDVYRQHTGEFSFIPGPLFNHIVLIDEVNRAPPKVQSALLEAMGERQITTSGISRKLAEPFMVAATQNPIEHEGTYPLPEAQLDRFMFFIDVQLPQSQQERRILDTVLAELQHNNTVALASASIPPPSITLDTLLQARHFVTNTHVSDAVRDYIVRLTMATRGTGAGGAAAEHIVQAASPRGSIYLAQAAQAQAWLDGRDFVTPHDVAALALDVLSGRIGLSYQARAQGISTRQVIERVLQATPKI